MMKRLSVALILVGSAAAVASTQSPYVAEEFNEIKSLSSGEISDLLQGKGMGFAKAAELNQYPGPRHVLELSAQLHLSGQQLVRTRKVFEDMHAKAKELGAQLVAYERELDSLFSASQISSSQLDALLLKIGETRARLRGTHLHAHLKMKKILVPHQIRMYDSLRGYSTASGNHEHTH